MREKITQTEINALLQGLAAAQLGGDAPDVSDVPNVPDAQEARSPHEPLPFFIPAAEHLHQGVWPGLQVINEQFARMAPEALIALLPQVCSMTALPLRQLPFHTALKDLPSPAHCHLVSVEPLAGWGLVAFDARLTLAAASKRFAGAGESIPADTVDSMTSSELARAALLLELIVSEYNKAWRDFYPLQMTAKRMLAQARLAHLAPAQERVVTSSFELVIANFIVRIDICLPHASLLPLRPLLRATTQGHRPQPDLHWRQHLTQELQSIEVLLAAKLARFDVTVATLLSLQAGDVLPFNAPSLLEATVDGVPLFSCEYGAQNGHHALRVEKSLRHERAVPLAPTATPTATPTPARPSHGL